MYIIDEKDSEYRFGDHGPKYLMRGPRMNFAIVQLMPGQEFDNHYHNIMEENFYILDGEAVIAVDGAPQTLAKGQFIHIEPGEAHYVVNRGSVPMRMAASLAPFQEKDKVDVPNPKI
jgi:quercetin dioxygenase-like cupin family protein